MKLLIVTQAIDTEDPVLGFFVRWIEEFARAPRSLGEVGKHMEHIEVICLKEGKHNFYSAKNAVPRSENSEEFSGTGVRVHSLGKERGVVSRAAYAWRFLSLVWRLRRDYDAVFVHMNQEYVVIGGWLWRLLGKRVYLWRNYHGGGFITDIAMAFCTKVFCTSRYSYTAKHPRTELMPVGVDTERFFSDARASAISRSVLFLSGMWPSKRPEVLIDALAILHKKGIECTGDFYGSPLPETKNYYESLKKRAAEAGLAQKVSFHPGVPNALAPDLYRTHEIFVNCSPSGMFDKTLFEAAACGSLVVASSGDFAELVDARLSFPEGDAAALARRLADLWALPSDGKKRLAESLKSEAAKHSLASLAERLTEALH